MSTGEDSGTLSLRDRLTRMEAKIDSLDTQMGTVVNRVGGLVDRQTLDRHDQRIRELEKVADKYVPDPATMLQQRKDWERIRSKLDSLDALDSYRRWLIGLVVAAIIEGGVAVGALYGAFHH